LKGVIPNYENISNETVKDDKNDEDDSLGSFDDGASFKLVEQLLDE
jgi:hypothetical protein